MNSDEIIRGFKAKAIEYLQKKRIGEVTFSSQTYQIQILDLQNDKEFWPFIQFNEENSEISDCFCTCIQEDESPYCEHLAAAILYIFRGNKKPLHIRFNHSLWNKLASIFAKSQGYETDILQKEEDQTYTCYSNTNKKLLYIKALSDKSQEFLSSIIENRQVETEQTSLKFSNLPQEELTLWREGRPSESLRYELSFWSDLAKYLMLKQENKDPYSISFSFAENKLPNYIHITFTHELNLGFYLSSANLPFIIPSLANLDSPLPLHLDGDDDIESISYDKKKRCLHLHMNDDSKSKKPTPIRNSDANESYQIGDWIFVSDTGFFPIKRPCFSSKEHIPYNEIDQALEAHRDLFQKYLKNNPIHPFPVKPSYHIAFDEKWNLHLNCYIFTPGDLQSLYSSHFGHWVYLEDDGFYRLENPIFDFSEKTIGKDRVSEFINQYRFWLNAQKGFETYLMHIESHLSYSLDENDTLSFTSYTDLSSESTLTCDFGEWIYVEGQGFYSKFHGKSGLPVRAGVKVKKNEIPIFIKINYDDLEQVPDFFSNKCPISKTGLRIILDDKEQVIITPEYAFFPEYEVKKVKIFEDYIYIQKNGFYELPPEIRLPAQYRKTTLISKANLHNFINYELSNLAGYTSYIDPCLKKPHYMHLVMKGIKEENLSDYHYLSLHLEYKTNNGSIDIIELYEALKQNKPFLFSDGGLISLATPHFDWLRQLKPPQLDYENHRVRLSTLELIRLDALEGLRGDSIGSGQNLLAALRNFQTPTPPITKGLKGKLRPYQHIGLSWLWFLYNYGLSGILCDDMGLGKTHQTMALMAAIKQDTQTQKVSSDETPRSKRIKKKFLIVCPTSVIYHWQDKLERFFPKMRILVYHGLNRSLKPFAQKYDVLLTSYGILRLDQKSIIPLSFTLAILDEIQVAKNHRSQTFMALSKVKAKMRLGLTGTPIENSLRELKTLFDLTLPGYMPSDENFRKLFVLPIERENDPNQKELLKRFIKPFILRRKKTEVLEELPEKTIEISHCELSQEQRHLYHDHLNQSREKLIHELEDEKKSIPFIHIFALLSLLKQICNHPACLNKDIDNYQKYQSGKWDLFIELLNEARESQQKIVVFSQYLSMLDIIERYLREKNIGFASIRGNTTNRAEQLKRFNKDPNCEVFVGSLKAVGLGVDLTAASIVIHYDRWWNAARENQATDRVHRMGQKRGVQVFKLVTKGTLEERIHKIIESKGELMEAIVTTEGHEQMKVFSRGDLIQLLQFVHVEPTQ